MASTPSRENPFASLAKSAAKNARPARKRGGSRGTVPSNLKGSAAFAAATSAARKKKMSGSKNG